jgi:hypothetical protein
MTPLDQQIVTNSLKVLQLKAPSFALLVRQLRNRFEEADAFEVDLDLMRVKGDLAVIRLHFQKPLYARTTSLDLAKRAAKAGWAIVKVPKDLALDLEFTTLAKNKGVKVELI